MKSAERVNNNELDGESKDEIIADSVSNIDHFPSSNKVMALQKAIKNKKVIVSGGVTLTADAFEFENKIRTHEQLKLARKLRGIMEDALRTAQKANDVNEVKKIFHEHKNEMLQLSSLTDAVLAGYTKGTYGDYDESGNGHEQKQLKIFRTSQLYLNGLQQKMLWEASPHDFFRDNQEKLSGPEPIDQSSISRNSSSSLTKAVTTETSLPKVARNTQRMDTQKNMNYHQLLERRQVNTHAITSEKEVPSHMERRTILKTVKSFKTINKSHGGNENESQKLEIKRHETSKNQLFLEHDLQIGAVPFSIIKTPSSNKSSKPNSSEKVTPGIQKITTSPSKPQSIGKKCHHCKEVKTDTFLCNYWFITGNKCKKYFCKECLRLYDDQGSNSEDWHCPSCLKKCKCRSCIKERERDELRGASKKRRLRN